MLKEWMDKDPNNHRKYEAFHSYWSEQNYDLCKDKILNNVKLRVSEDKRQIQSKRLKTSKAIDYYRMWFKTASSILISGQPPDFSIF